MSCGDNVPCIKVLQATKLQSYHYPEVVNALRANSVLPESPAGLRTRRYCEVLRILTLLLSNTEGMTRPRLLLYSKVLTLPVEHVAQCTGACLLSSTPRAPRLRCLGCTNPLV